MEETTEKIVDNDNTKNDEKISGVVGTPAGKPDFDIVDFIISHSDERSVRKKSKAPKIILCIIVGLLIVTMCLLFVFWSVNYNKDKLYGSWVTSTGLVMTIDEKTITINGQTNEYIKDEKNVIAINMNNEYYKMIYELNGDELVITIPDESGVATISYKRKSE